MSKSVETVIVTRHSGLVSVLLEDGIITKSDKILSHATEEQVRGKHVIGVLPLHLAAEAESVTALTMNIPPELRGKELTAEQTRQCMGELTRYTVNKA